ncbi:MAG: YbhB and YbcL [Candidatus Nomurabacteria bacterium GW2011_GWB1_40_7]|uniref:YbhB and YbcL n=1 Tax=Candidatus Nomurabacteria bacterium GW2011_GWB1_40_7 TaxID=1618744 RepID=A0A0G0T0Q4_9BACT|nr:MAG: YbhB and YbcL [Candidatus Nomurabacteria bacterium GW2011_GWB1_40_7]
MRLESPEFENGGNIPSRFTCDGEGTNPELIFSDISKEAKSLVLLMDDPDAPMGIWDHWIVFNMPPDTKGISENSIPNGVVGKNTRGDNKYGPPCPPDREHRYFFKLYALNTKLGLDENATKQDVLNAMQEHILTEAELMGRYNRI